MLADAAATYATATGTDLDLGAALGNMRLSGFPLLAEDGVISQFNEADNTGLNCSLATPRVDSLGSVNETRAPVATCGRSVRMEGQCI
jgi:peroxiredoxin